MCVFQRTVSRPLCSAERAATRSTHARNSVRALGVVPGRPDERHARRGEVRRRGSSQREDLGRHARGAEGAERAARGRRPARAESTQEARATSMARAMLEHARMPSVTVVGAGLAGCEVAWQLAERGIDVRLVEQKPLARTPAQTTRRVLRARVLELDARRGARNAVGLLKEELRRAGSLILACADATRVPAGGALAVDRERFSARVTERLRAHPRVTLEARVVEAIPAASPDAPVVLATGPLTGDALAADLARVVGRRAPRVLRRDRPHRERRLDRLGQGLQAVALRQGRPSDGGDDEAYVNCPFDEARYRAFVADVLARAEGRAARLRGRALLRGVPAHRGHGRRAGEMTLAFGPMKPVGLVDPRTGRRPFAVVQLRPEDAAATAYNLVGFQTRMTWPEQARVLADDPGPRARRRSCASGASTGTRSSTRRGCSTSACSCARGRASSSPGRSPASRATSRAARAGFVCGVMLAQSLLGHAVTPPPPTTALGGVLTHLARASRDYQPSNVTWAWLPPMRRPRA